MLCLASDASRGFIALGKKPLLDVGFPGYPIFQSCSESYILTRLKYSNIQNTSAKGRGGKKAVNKKYFFSVGLK